METKLRSLSLAQGKHELCINQVTNTGPSYSLFYTTFDGFSWTTAIALPHQMCSPNGMSLADHHGILVGVHRAVRNRKLYWNTYTSSSWTRAQAMPCLNSPAQFQTSPSRPAVATFSDRLYCLYRGEGNEIWFTSAGSNLNDGWSSAVNVGGYSRTIDGPALASYDGRLISVIRGADNIIYWDSFDGSRWRGYEKLNGKTSGSPAVAVYKNELYLCIRGMDRPGTGGLYWFKLSGSKWSPWVRIDYQLGLQGGPSLAVFNNQLVCTLRGPENKLHFTTFDGSRWSQVIKIPSQASCQGEQGLCGIHSKLFCVYPAPK